ncbi:hypothetical protein C1645_816128 [Glomus cerebriforme]|uniref:Uncharacterized protein n=1 Tax=Glomus cerebriforme TaxID=658196 RepID=A0A397TH81_9GLOM|nr:hypothetical protein C1645_816128 [Glomus cerebriforme]
MFQDENEGSDIELEYYDHNGTIITLYNQCSKLSNSPKNKDESLDNVKKYVSTPRLPQSENVSLQYSNNESELSTKSPMPP